MIATLVHFKTLPVYASQADAHIGELVGVQVAPVVAKKTDFSV